MTTRRHIGVDPLAVSIDEASELLSISRGKVYELIARGEFAPTIHFGKSVVVPLADLRAWLASRIAAECEAREAEKQRNAPLVVIKPAPPVKARNGSK